MKFSKIHTTRQAEILHLAIQVFVGGVIWMASSLNVAHADIPTLPPTDVTAPAPGCPPGQVHYGSSNGQCGPMPGGTQPGAGPGGPGGSGGYGGGGGGSSTSVPGKANTDCSSETAEGAAGNLFRVWMQGEHPLTWVSLEPDGKVYKIQFADNKYQKFKWGLPLQASLPLQPTGSGCTSS